MLFIAVPVLVLLLFTTVNSFGISCRDPNAPTLSNSTGPRLGDLAVTVPKEFILAFVGDTTLGEDTREMLQLVMAEGAAGLVISGDLDYEDSPKDFITQLDQILGDLPVFVSIGNHDLRRWQHENGYAELLTSRYERLGMTKYCSGEVGVKSSCDFHGIRIITSGVGTRGQDHVAYLHSALSAPSPPNTWKFCSWHKNQAKLQAGSKKDDVGWGAYETCREAGAIVLTGHNHAYTRSHLLSSFEDQTIVSSSNQLNVRPGASWVTVTGTGGRHLVESGPYAYAKWWAKSITINEDIEAFGALFCKFNEIDGSPDKASCYFKAITETILDKFTMTTSDIPFTKSSTENSDVKPDVNVKSTCQTNRIELTATSFPTTLQHNSDPELVTLSYEHYTTFQFPLNQTNSATELINALNNLLIDGPHIREAYLQVYGGSNVQQSVRAAVSISFANDIIESSNNNNDNGSTIPWTLDDECERHEVWDSPNLASAMTTTQNPSLVNVRVKLLEKVATGEVAVYTKSEGNCINPSLLLITETC